MKSAQTIYRALLRCYPAAFRDEYGDQMRLTFKEQLAEAKHQGGLFSQANLWVQATRDALTIAPQEHGHVILQDLRYAIRALAAKPTFAAIAIGSLALGIGANTAIFSVWNGILRASLPGVDKPEELVILTNPGEAGGWHGSVTGDRNWLTYAEFEELRDQTTSFSGIMASQSGLANWQVRLPGSGWEEAHERLVSGGYFPVLGVKASVGRLFTKEDDYAAVPHTVLSYNYWRRRFGGRADVVGSTITVGALAGRNADSPGVARAALTIIGVTPRGFIGETAGQQPDIWIPLRLQRSIVPSADWLHDTPPSKLMWLHAFGRLKPGVTLRRADADANRIFKRGLEAFYGSVASEQRRRELLDQHLKLQLGGRGASEVRNDFSTSLTALMAAVGLLLLIACANLSNLLMARGAARRPEMALRISLGASRARLVRQLLTESFLLAALGSSSGLVLAYFLQTALVQMLVAANKHFRLDFTLNPSVLLFTFAITAAAALVFGLLPAWQATQANPSAGLKQQHRGGATGATRWGSALVSLQIALSVPLLLSAGLLARTFWNLQNADLGYPVQHLLLTSIDLHDDTAYSKEHRSQLLRDLTAKIQQIPGVRAVSYSELGVFSGSESNSAIEVEGFIPQKDTDKESNLDLVGPGYFSTLGVQITLGRDIQNRDTGEGTPKVCVINQAFAGQFFAKRNPLGMHITSVDSAGKRTGYVVVGVAKNARTQDLRGYVEPRYFAAEQQHAAAIEMPKFLIRTAAGTTQAQVSAPVRRAMLRADAQSAADSVHSLLDRLAPLTAQDRATAQLSLAFGSLALMLSAIGLYGVLSYGVARRQGEIAIRMAMGADAGRVIAMILCEASGLVVTGLLVGAGLGYGASRLISTRLYGVSPQDPLTLAFAAVLLMFVAFGAAYLPARRASKLEPIVALRSE